MPKTLLPGLKAQANEMIVNGDIFGKQISTFLENGYQTLQKAERRLVALRQALFECFRLSLSGDN